MSFGGPGHIISSRETVYGMTRTTLVPKTRDRKVEGRGAYAVVGKTWPVAFRNIALNWKWGEHWPAYNEIRFLCDLGFFGRDGISLR